MNFIPTLVFIFITSLSANDDVLKESMAVFFEQLDKIEKRLEALEKNSNINSNSIASIKNDVQWATVSLNAIKSNIHQNKAEQSLEIYTTEALNNAHDKNSSSLLNKNTVSKNELYIKAWRLKSRKEPSLSSDVNTIYKMGTIIPFIEETDKWYKTSNGDYFLKSQYVDKVSKTQYTHESKWPLNVRTAPGYDFELIKNIHKGDSLTLLGKVSSNWYLTSDKHYVYIEAL